MANDKPVSHYLDYLPAMYRQESFLGRFLLAFERLLSRGAPGSPQPALEEIVDHVDRFFRPGEAPAEFLPWLAGWVALSLREDWDEKTKRQFIQRIVPLYRQRGTKAGLKDMLQVYLGENVPIAVYDTRRDFEFDPPAHFFQVAITVRDRDPAELRRKQQIAQAIIEQEKPVHTFYALRILIPTMRLVSEKLLKQEGGEALLLGKTTLLGTQNIGH
jgi:phage tail-like protein